MSRGNRGSSASELAREQPELASAFDLSVLQAYCDERRVGIKGGNTAGKWWHHGPHSQETDDSFRRRCMLLRRWLGSLAGGGGMNPRTTDCVSPPPSPRLIMVTHGGVMEEAFGYSPNAPNCGFRVFDVARNGALLRVSTGERVDVSFPLCKPLFKVLSVICTHENEDEESRATPDSESLFNVEVQVGTQIFMHSVREIELRLGLHDRIRDELDPDVHQRLRLGNKFPDHIRWSGRELSMYIQDYLEQLATAAGDDEFPEHLLQLVDHVLLGGLLNQRPGFA